MRVLKLKPSLFIIHTVKHTSGLSYRQEGREERQEGRSEITTYTGIKTIADVDEYKRARAVRAQIETKLTGKEGLGAVKSAFAGGLFAPDTPQTWERLQTLQDEITTILDDFRATARIEQITSRIIVFKIMGENRMLLESITDQIIEALENMREAVASADPKRIRKALQDARGLPAILPPAQSAALGALMNDLSSRARKITKLAGEQGANLDQWTALSDTAPIDAAALELFDEAGTIEADNLPIIDSGSLDIEGGALDVFEAAQIDAADIDETEAAALEADTLDAAQIDNSELYDKAQDWADTEQEPEPKPENPIKSAREIGKAQALNLFEALDADDAEAQEAADALRLLKQAERAARIIDRLAANG